MHTGTTEILLVEDRADHQRLTQEAFKEGNVRSRLTAVSDGVEALERLTEAGDLPDLILLDLKMPRAGGHEVLARIKADDRLKHIPVVVLSSSDDDRDVCRSYVLNANAYVIKPLDLDRFINTLRAIEQFWLGTAVLPSVAGARRRPA